MAVLSSASTRALRLEVRTHLHTIAMIVNRTDASTSRISIATASRQRRSHSGNRTTAKYRRASRVRVRAQALAVPLLPIKEYWFDSNRNS